MPFQLNFCALLNYYETLDRGALFNFHAAKSQSSRTLGTSFYGP